MSSPSCSRVAAPVGWIGGWSVEDFLPRVGTARRFANTQSTSFLNGELRMVFKIPSMSSEGGYTVLSVLGYEMNPFMYRSSAIRIAFAAEKPSRAAATI